MFCVSAFTKKGRIYQAFLDTYNCAIEEAEKIKSVINDMTIVIFFTDTGEVIKIY